MEKKVTKEMIIADILELHQDMAGVLMSGGMHCVTCPASMGETLEEACYVHGIDPELMEERLNAYLLAMEVEKQKAAAAE